MILKKPYAFIIKHFRAIHLIMLIPMIYLAFATNGIVHFFRSYISNGYMVGSNIILSNLASSYINFYMYLAVILILGILVTLSFVLQNKSKPTKFYNISILYYLILFALITGCYVIFGMIENDTLDNTFARILRDLSVLVYYSQYIFILYVLSRGVGFNIKQFNFKDDLIDLQISAEDSEEFEFLVGRDTYKTKRNIRRFFRELKYYYKENKFVFTVIFVILGGVIVTSLFMNKEVYSKVYKEGEITSFGNLNMEMEEAYISNLDLKGDIIKDDKTYVIVKIKITNRFRDDETFNYANVQLVVNNLRISPSITMGENFADLGNPYSGGQIKGNSDYSYILVYEMDKNLVHGGKYELEAYSGADTTVGGLGVLSKKFSLNPKKISDEVTTKNINAGNVIDLDDTLMGKSKVALINYSLMGRFTYTYQYCVNSNNCYDSNNDLFINQNEIGKLTLMVMDYSLTLDNEVNYMAYSNKNFKNFFNDFMKIKYSINGKDYYSDVNLINPNGYADKLVFKIDSNISSADKIEAIITIRDKAFQIKLK